MLRCLLTPLRRGPATSLRARHRSSAAAEPPPPRPSPEPSEPSEPAEVSAFISDWADD